jgi:3-deoxy-D-manno-octulosonic-acid transferase
LEPPPPGVSLEVSGNEKIILAGSTHEGEEELLLRVYGELIGEMPLRLILAPRHISRAERLRELSQSLGFRTALRSQGVKDWDVLIVDTLGELKSLYRYCDVAVVGGTFVPVGGHNLLEPLLWRKPVVFGKYTHKVRDLEKFLISKACGFRAEGEEELRDILRKLIKSPPEAVDIESTSRRIKECYLKHILSELE